jgi:hypothetical protein
MEKEFVTYEQALALKELGFDEECLKLWKNITLFTLLVNPEEFKRVVSDLFTPAPLKQQVFRWFRDKHEWYANLSSWLHEEEIGTYHEYEIYGTPKGAYGSIKFKTYEEAENACIDKLIELAKQQDND